MLASDFGSGQVLWSMLWFFLFFIWIWILITVFADIFRSHDLSGWAKAIWVIFVIVAPYLGVFVYLIAQNRGMVERSMADAQAQQQQLDDYVRSVAKPNGGAAGEIDKAKRLLDSGAITQSEFDALKAKALV